MTQMAGTNPKLAAIFGGGNFGMNVGKMSQQAQKSQNADRMTAMGVDANAAKADIEAEYIKESAPYKAAMMAPQQQGGGGGFGDILGSVAGIVGGLGGGGGVGGFAGSVNTPGFGMNANTQTAFGSGGGSVSGFGTFGPNWGFPSS